MNWTVKNVKSWMGRDGIGTTCTLYRDGKRVATCRDDGNGGEMDFDWLDFKAPKVDINIITSDYDAEMDENGNRPEKAHTYKGTPEQKLLAEYANAITEDSHGMTLRKDCGWIVSDLCDAFERAKRMKNKTCFILRDKNGHEAEYEIKAPYTPELKADIEKRHGTALVRILNTEFASADEVEKKRLADLKRKCKGKTLLRLKGDAKNSFRIYPRPYSYEVATMLRAKYEVIEIINETLAA